MEDQMDALHVQKILEKRNLAYKAYAILLKILMSSKNGKLVINLIYHN